MTTLPSSHASLTDCWMVTTTDSVLDWGVSPPNTQYKVNTSVMWVINTVTHMRTNDTIMKMCWVGDGFAKTQLVQKALQVHSAHREQCLTLSATETTAK